MNTLEMIALIAGWAGFGGAGVWLVIERKWSASLLEKLRQYEAERQRIVSAVRNRKVNRPFETADPKAVLKTLKANPGMSATEAISRGNGHGSEAAVRD